MAYLKTVLTYRVPGEAEVDQSLLEANGITVHLMNDRSPPSDLVYPLPIELQVPAEQMEAAVAILRMYNPGRFGSVDRVRQLDRELRRAVGRFVLGGILPAVATWFLVNRLVRPGAVDWRFGGAAVAWLAGGLAALRWWRD